MMKICLTPFRLLWTPYLVGHAWVYLNWALGLQANGCDVTILETFREDEEPEQAVRILNDLKKNLCKMGIDFEITLLLSENQVEKYRCIRDELAELIVPLEATIDQAEFLLNFHYGLTREIVNRFKRSALVDIDPGLLQLWVNEGQFDLFPHDIYFTIGETVGQPGALFPDLDIKWHYTPPVVFLPAWPPAESAHSAPFTTISNWWSNWESLQGEVFNNEKRTSFLEYLELPRHTTTPLELALFIGPETEEQETQSLKSNGWKVCKSLEVSSTLEQYRSYIQNSRGEFSCAKPSCMRLQNAWISDRTLCYLASGKPAVVQHTGPSRFLPDAEGLIRFRSFDEAVQALAMVEKDYDHHSRQASVLAADYFNAKKVAGHVLERVLEIKTKHH